MKKIYFIIFFVFIGFGVSSQAQVYFNNAEITTFEELTDETFSVDLYTYVKNDGNKDISLDWTKNDITIPEEWNGTQVCFIPSNDPTSAGICWPENVVEGGANTPQELKVPKEDSVKIKVSFTMSAPALGDGEMTFSFSDPVIPTNSGEATFKAQMAATGINDLVNEKSFQTYPNPVVNNLNVELQNYDEIYYLEIYNMVGQSVKYVQLETSNRVDPISLSDLNEGIYFISILDSNENVIETKRFSKVR